MTSSHRFILAGNWKLNLSAASTQKYFKEFAYPFQQMKSQQVQVVFFPPALSLQAAADSLKTLGMQSLVQLGVQNICSENSGAFTGENSAAMAKELGANWVLIGHSERRHLFGEPNDGMQKKVARSLAENMTPILCIGENLEQRKGNQTKEVLKQQLFAGLQNLKSVNSLVIAYEPVWAIGTGQVASLDQIAETHEWIRELLLQIDCTKELSSEIPLLYGGSVNPQNCAEISKVKNVDGLLVGGASLQPTSFLQLLEKSQNRV